MGVLSFDGQPAREREAVINLWLRHTNETIPASGGFVKTVRIRKAGLDTLAAESII